MGNTASSALSANQVHQLRLRNQLLDSSRPTEGNNVAAIVRRLVGLQSQEAPQAVLSVRVRSDGLCSDDVETARVTDRSIVRTWAQRGTLHLLPAEDLKWLLPLYEPGCLAMYRAARNRYGLDDDTCAKGIKIMRDLLADKGPQTRAEIAERLGQDGISFPDQNAGQQFLYFASYKGAICYGPLRGKEQTYVRLEDWIPGWKPSEQSREDSCQQLALRYLTAFGPARAEDFAAWSGLPRADVKTAWAAISDQLLEVTVADQPAFLLKSQAKALDDLTDELKLLRLLPRYDTYLLGYQNRDAILAQQYAKQINPGSGIINAALLVNGQIVGTWRTERAKTGCVVQITPFAALDDELMPALEAEVADLARFTVTPTTLQILPPA